MIGIWLRLELLLHKSGWVHECPTLSAFIDDGRRLSAVWPCDNSCFSNYSIRSASKSCDGSILTLVGNHSWGSLEAIGTEARLRASSDKLLRVIFVGTSLISRLLHILIVIADHWLRVAECSWFGLLT